MKTLNLISKVVSNLLGLNSSSPATPIFLNQKTGGSQLMGSYAQNNSISIFFGATCSQVTNNN